MSQPFWNLSGGVRPAEPAPGLFAQVCEDIGHHVYDDVYGPSVCARCGWERVRTLNRARPWHRWAVVPVAFMGKPVADLPVSLHLTRWGARDLAASQRGVGFAVDVVRVRARRG